MHLGPESRDVGDVSDVLLGMKREGAMIVVVHQARSCNSTEGMPSGSTVAFPFA
jgi:hypothetical protein